MSELKNLKFEATIDTSSIEVLNSEFSKAKAYIMYYGENRNKSYMSKETVEAAIPSLFNVPVIGEFLEKKEDFGSHGGKLIISSEGMEYVMTTVPYGVVPESCNPRFETVDEKEYLVADVILWSGRYEELQKTVNEFSNQSMEINVLSGEFKEDKDYYDIQGFEFSALCLLGQEVIPCFESSKVIAYSLDGFKSEMDEMLKQYKLFMKQDESVEEVEQTENFENEGEEEATIVEEVETKPVSREFELTAQQKLEKLHNSLPTERVTQPNPNEPDEEEWVSTTTYWVMDYNSEYVYISVNYWDMNTDKYYQVRAKYTETDVDAIVDKSTFEEIFSKWLTQSEIDALETERNRQVMELQQERHDLLKEVEAFKADADSKNNIISELQSFKDKIEMELKQSEIEEIISDFENVLKDNEEFLKIKENAVNLEIDELEKELFALEGKVKHVKSKKEKKPVTFSRVSVVENDGGVKTSSYGSADKYIPKK